MAAIRDTLVTVRHLLLVAGWALVIGQLALADIDETESKRQWLRAHQQVRARILEVRRAQSIQAATNTASEPVDQLIASDDAPEDCDETITDHLEDSAP